LDKVIQIDSPSTVSSFLQRMGRTGRRSGSNRNCLFLTTNQEAFLLALGVTYLWSKAWVEAARPPAAPWPLAAQQALAATLERGEWPEHELCALLSESFPEMATGDIRLLVSNLIEKGYLDSAESLIRIGSLTEREYGRGHYRDLLASFSGPQLLVGRFGAAEIGYIDPTTLTGEDPQRRLLLAGRSWLVKEIDWSKRVVWLESAKEGGKARWMGGARSLSREVCQGMLSALAQGPAPIVHLSQRAKIELAATAEEFPVSDQADFTSQVDGTHMRTLTFAGTKANRTYARIAANGGQKVKFDAISVQAPTASFAHGYGSGASSQLTLSEVATFAEGIKFAPCVPEGLLATTVQTRCFE
jgi:ATP-dependent Lhr-like helicase